MSEDIEYKEDEQLIGKVNKVIFETSRFLGIVLKDIRAFNPPPENLSDDVVFIQWTAVIDAVAEEPELTRRNSGFRIGGRLSWEKSPTDTEIELGVRRSVGFSVLAGIAPEREFIYQALEASMWSQNSVILGAFIFECMNLMQASMSGIKSSSQVATPAKVMGAIANKLKESAEATLIDVRKNLQAAYDGKPMTSINTNDTKH